MLNSSGFGSSHKPAGDSRNSSRPFGLSLPFLRSKAQTEAANNKMSLSQIKLQVELCFQDVDGQDAERLRHKIRGMRDVKDLWMLRSDVHQLISRHLGQTEAAKRINALLPIFEHWIPEKSRVKI